MASASAETIMLLLLLLTGIIIFLAYVWFVGRLRKALREKDNQRKRESIRRYRALIGILKGSEKTARESLKIYEELLDHYEKDEKDEFFKMLDNKIASSRKDHLEWYQRNLSNLEELRSQFEELKRSTGKGKKIKEGLAKVKAILDEREKMIESTKKELDQEIDKLEEIKAGKIDILKVIISDMRGKLKSGHFRKEAEKAMEVIIGSAKKEGISRGELGL